MELLNGGLLLILDITLVVSTTSDLGRDTRNDTVVVGEGLVLGEHLGTVLVRLDDARLAVEEVNLLERETLGLGDAEVREDQASGASGTPDEEHLDTETSRLDTRGTVGGLVDEVRGGVSDTKVPEPVGGDGEGHGLGSDGEGEEFTGEHPDDGTP